jgi:putative spermidine/putrescine transport system ATP-binding protein
MSTDNTTAPAPSGTGPGGPAQPERQPAIRLRGLRRTFGSYEAVAGIDLDIADGEFFTMLGPSGSGKTTVLRMIAGFERPTAGSVVLAGRDVTALAPFERDVNTVFQDYALFPHLTVLQNIEYGLRVRRVGRAERARLAHEALATVQLPGFGRRKPGELSGGQRQRVALARALVNRPKVLLLDEPLGALDLKLRRAMQGELKDLQREVGITFLFVTHDQEEALTMSDRVAVINQGRLEQVGTPARVYSAPASAFVADFVGTSNLLHGVPAERVVGRTGTFSIRPEKIRLRSDVDTPAGVGETSALGTIRDVVFTGPSTRYEVELDVGGHLSVLRQNDGSAPRDRFRVAERVRLTWRTEHTFCVPSKPHTGQPNTDAN